MTAFPAEHGNTFHDPRAAHIRVTRSEDPEGVALRERAHELIAAGANPDQLVAPIVRQPWHCSLIAGNEDKVWWTEQYDDRGGARSAILFLGRLFSPVGRATLYLPIPSTGEGGGYLEVWLDNDELGGKCAVPVRYFDLRTTEAS